ncbi:hypothetical protein [Sutcliffiella rhizosphaerae]|uniref:Uncharacterized protein n=1 Tax=Sutcliffiella rhizosphaerae TaxID=2880967 RepID=A0ABM8YQW8_9BACI|nr:hypothetical protein [Sutcliffiella rhizosphaerae]CAG9622305.1 hypothetical protein BACCIP111883_03096 [Sutcliffiella rhizosphaerae]
MSRFNTLFRFIIIGMIIGGFLGLVLAYFKYGIGLFEILDGESPWDGYEERAGRELFWGFIVGGIFYGAVAYIIAIIFRTNAGKHIIQFFKAKF